jgi:hypothetical protein
VEWLHRLPFSLRVPSHNLLVVSRLTSFQTHTCFGLYRTLRQSSLCAARYPVPCFLAASFSILYSALFDGVFCAKG